MGKHKRVWCGSFYFFLGFLKFLCTVLSYEVGKSEHVKICCCKKSLLFKGNQTSCTKANIQRYTHVYRTYMFLSVHQSSVTARSHYVWRLPCAAKANKENEKRNDGVLSYCRVAGVSSERVSGAVFMLHGHRAILIRSGSPGTAADGSTSQTLGVGWQNLHRNKNTAWTLKAGATVAAERKSVISLN